MECLDLRIDCACYSSEQSLTAAHSLACSLSLTFPSISPTHHSYALWDTRAAVEVLPLGVTYSLMLYSSNWALSLLTVPMVGRWRGAGAAADDRG
jgi:hypothetical protein